ncbi:hypothetical protein FOTG_18800 [Fusarium oxysporum f. sp. vasinfectum 25433]|uniref:Uncharacterized protein n=1 Tax=Fusarium oxysporum f. sp. vasinfectum 25433 TaxID=1089449 RepID=X0KGH4_FUSOX|nr:hypothetical protein FOTG_18800 [Fusarium oxysporum f. sp. vasinfectum 25433]EXM12715.1 hypothetical protein FOTG_18800 [Fusarium oxysporum f. sp. vasinfectum 25433]EXM12716.1 hypothetical protein FOTG_18800 [Fusarium oxysporum f. sp. vasinfectum 25433]
MSLSVSLLTPEALVLPNSDEPFIHSLIHERNENDHTGNVSVPRLSESEENHKAQYLRPVHAASIADPRIGEVVPSKWTTWVGPRDRPPFALPYSPVVPEGKAPGVA